ncbi:hypothetical protein [cf. Phormidesmis sp. LEGE 11477]|uniref:hypothetical protein n=1 Tax=cf. Phormidesmis sp. LEGE 11477 TaxID=1828680 RepID=UPI0018822186|nr:hypothetical protein [cf. Phormidesmis sp. LEGE 11477]MBE9064643.1 hypothetical protein [cf. Phormidesmis sp. LEGE 11477]
MKEPVMAVQLTTHGLSPQLSAVLSGLNISLEGELIRYRRNRRLGSSHVADALTSIETDPVFSENPEEAALVMGLPSVPPNKKLLAASSYDRDFLGSDLPALPVSAQRVPKPLVDPVSSGTCDLSMSALLSPLTKAANSSAEHIVPATVGSSQPLSNQLSQARFAEAVGAVEAIAPTLAGSNTPSSYLTSSEKLIESLEDQSTQLESFGSAVDRSRRKTVSLIAGAALGFFGLVAGLGASYVMSNPLVTQRLANGLADLEVENTATDFDPPGPDLSSAEFVEIGINNLSSLQMPETGLIAPDLLNSGQLPPTPPMPAGLSAPAAPAAASTVPPAAEPEPSPTSAVAETQAAVLPVGLTYYVTVPFSSEQALLQIRETISEAFVRQFADGNRIQVAAFDNAQSAQQFIEELKESNIAAEVYGPTTD